MSIRTLLVPYDFSEQASHACDLAVKMAEKARARIELLNVVPPMMSYEAYSGLAISKEFVESSAGDARAKLRTLAQSIEGKGVPTGFTVISDGSGAADAICEFAESQQVDLIVIGTHGYSGMQLGLLGSVAEKVCTAATVPVINVNAQSQNLDTDFEKLLVAVDFSPGARAAAKAAGEIALALGSSVELMHVFEMIEPAFMEMSLPQVDRFAVCDAAKSAMVEDQKLLEAEGVSVSRHVTIGRPASEIVKHAESGGFDLVVVGTRGMTGFKRMVMGSIARRVITSAGCPVVSCRAGGTAG